MQIITSELFCSWVGPTVPPGGWVHLPALELWAVNRRCYKKLVCREQQTAPALRSFFCELELQSGRLVLQVCESCVRNRRFLPTHITSAAACFLYFPASGIETLTSDCSTASVLFLLLCQVRVNQTDSNVSPSSPPWVLLLSWLRQFKIFMLNK